MVGRSLDFAWWLESRTAWSARGKVANGPSFFRAFGLADRPDHLSLPFVATKKPWPGREVFPEEAAALWSSPQFDRKNPRRSTACIGCFIPASVTEIVAQVYFAFALVCDSRLSGQDVIRDNRPANSLAQLDLRFVFLKFATSD